MTSNLIGCPIENSFTRSYIYYSIGFFFFLSRLNPFSFLCCFLCVGLTRPLVDGAAINIMENLTDAKRLHSPYQLGNFPWQKNEIKYKMKILENTAAAVPFVISPLILYSQGLFFVGFLLLCIKCWVGALAKCARRRLENSNEMGGYRALWSKC